MLEHQGYLGMATPWI